MGIVLVGFMHRASMVLENKKKTDKEMTGRVSLVLAEIYITKKSIWFRFRGRFHVETFPWKMARAADQSRRFIDCWLSHTGKLIAAAI